MITSTANRQVKRVIQLQKKGKLRREDDCFIAEGMKMALEAPRERILQVYMSESFAREKGLPGQLEHLPCEVVDDRVFEQMSDTITPQGDPLSDPAVSLHAGGSSEERESAAAAVGGPSGSGQCGDYFPHGRGGRCGRHHFEP